MIFLIEYDRKKGRLVKIKSLQDTQRSEADEMRFALELALKKKNLQHEVVLLEAKDKEALQRTHRRYFQSIKEMQRTIRTEAA